ncbi:MAG: twin-arginine translocation signal domain-containing protein [Betaproteobacteria bacterium]|nr:MAG: twin-arginine translocation signal domain-containing protein [Betaproteobacteria bacterium]
MLLKRLTRRAPAPTLPRTLDRREFLKRSGIAAGGAGLAATLPFNLIERAEGETPAAAVGKAELKHTICPHCAVGCSIDATVENGVWTRQNPVFDSPINLGAHCAKGAAARETTNSDRRLKYPMKLENGRYRRLSWDQALDEISAKLLELRKASGPDAVYWIGSSKHCNEQAYLLRKFVSLWGTNNCDHQARICHSTTVAGVANTFGYGAMTNSFNDMLNTKAMLFIGSNAAEAHPVSMQMVLHAKENGARMIVVDPRFTRTAAKAHHHIAIRPGTDIPFVWGVLRTIFENRWEDAKFIAARVHGMEDVRREVAQWTPQRVEAVTGVKPADVRLVAETLAKNRPSTVVWCMGITQHTVGSANVRALSILQLALGNIGVSGGGTNIFRGHDNVQGATDVGPNADSLPAYYGLTEAAWRHWAGVWGLSYDWIQGRFASKELMEKPGMTISRWIDGVLEKSDAIDQGSNLRAVFYWGHAPNSQTRGLDMAEAMKKLDLLVVIDPYPSATAAMAAMERTDGVYLLPAATQFESHGSVTNSNRSLQWREQVVAPVFESRKDHTIMAQLAQRLGFGAELTKNFQMQGDEPVIEDILREINRGALTIGYSGQSPERLKLHMLNKHTFNARTLRAEGGPCDGEYYGLPWPCWGTPELKHPGTPLLYDESKSVAQGGLPFRANWGIEHNGQSMLAADGSATAGSEITTGYPQFDSVLLKKLGWWSELTPAEQASAQGKSWSTDVSGGIIRVAIKHGCAPFGNARARCVVWNFPDPVPVHREPLYSSRPDLVKQYPTYDDKKTFWRLPTLYRSIQQAADYSAKFPLVMTSGRLVEYEGGGDESRSNIWLAELQQEMFCDIHPADANDRGVKPHDYIWVATPAGARIKVRARVTRSVGRGVVFLPYHFAGWWQGKDIRDKYPEGAVPYVSGEAANTAWTYGYDAVTMMQETKTSLCQITRA